MPTSVGRPTKFTTSRAARVLDGLRTGMTRGAACSEAEVKYITLYRWIKRHPAFAQQVEEAELAAEARFTAVIAKAAFGHQVTRTRTIEKSNGDHEIMTDSYFEYDWRAAMEWLKRRRRDDWSDRQEIEQHIKELPPLIINGPPAHDQ